MESASAWYLNPTDEQRKHAIEVVSKRVRKFGGIGPDLQNDLRARLGLTQEQIEDFVVFCRLDDQQQRQQRQDAAAAAAVVASTQTQTDNREPAAKRTRLTAASDGGESSQLTGYPHPSELSKWPQFVEWFFTFTKLLDALCAEFHHSRQAMRTDLNDNRYDQLMDIFQAEQEHIDRCKHANIASVTTSDAQTVIAHYLKMCQLMVFQGLTVMSDVSEEIETLFRNMQSLCFNLVSQMTDINPMLKDEGENLLKTTYTHARECILVLYLDNRYERRISHQQTATFLSKMLKNLEAAIAHFRSKKSKETLATVSEEDGATETLAPEEEFKLPEATEIPTTTDAGLGFVTLILR